MTEEQKTAKGLLEHFSKERALAHIAYVLSPDFGLSKAHLRIFWMEVRREVLTPILNREYKDLTTNSN